MPRGSIIGGFAIAAMIALSPALTPAAMAQDAPPPPAGAGPEKTANFSMQPVEGGLMKLDNRSGAMSFCSARGGAWVCEAVPEDRAALEAEIGRLQARIATLESRRPGVSPGVPDIMVPPGGSAGSSTRPPVPPETVNPDDDARMAEDAQRKLDEAMEMAEHVFKRFLGMIDRLRGETPRRRRSSGSSVQHASMKA